MPSAPSGSEETSNSYLKNSTWLKNSKNVILGAKFVLLISHDTVHTWNSSHHMVFVFFFMYQIEISISKKS